MVQTSSKTSVLENKNLWSQWLDFCQGRRTHDFDSNVEHLLQPSLPLLAKALQDLHWCRLSFMAMGSLLTDMQDKIGSQIHRMALVGRDLKWMDCYGMWKVKQKAF